MKTAVVILNWNGVKFLHQFLPNVIKYTITTPDTQVIVVDNGSTDNSVEWVKQNCPNAELICFDKNHGFTKGYNKALAQIDAKYFILLNSDVDVSPNWFDPLVELMDTTPDVGACMPKILSYHQPEYFEYAGAAGGFIDKYGYPFCRGRIIGNLEKDNNQYNTPIDVFWATGACLMIRSELYLQLGGLDEVFFAHMEEIDLCWRLHRLGHRVMCQPQSTVYHVGGGALPNNSPRKLFLNYRNNLLMLYKNLPSKSCFWIILIRLFLDGTSGLIYLLSGKFSYFEAVIKAHWAFFGLISSFNEKRKHLLSIETTKVKTGVFPHSIVLRYFKAKKQLKFSDLKF